MDRCDGERRARRRALELFDEVGDLTGAELESQLERVDLTEPDVGPILRAMLDGARRDGILSRGLESVVSDVFRDGFDPLDASGRMLGHYRLLRRIGQGGMGEVFEGERADGEFEQRVAIKLLRWGAGGAEAAARFLRERRILARLEHPGIARVLDGGGATDGCPYLVMEFIDGEPLDEFCDRHGLTIEQRLRLFVEVCRTVAFAHRQLVVHRDLKPSNILVDDRGCIHLLDFGIAKLLAGDAEDDLTLVGQRPMTPDFAAPEQFEGGVIGTATDVYALGLILFELLAGRRARSTVVRRVDTIPARPSDSLATEGRDEGDTPRAVAASRGLTLPKLRRRLRGDLDLIVLAALRPAHEDRYGSADALAEDVERHLMGYPIRARNVGWTTRAHAFVRRNRGTVGATIAIVLAVVVGVVSTLHQARERSHQAQITEAVSTFLLNLFADSEPLEAKDSGMTALDLLDRGAERVTLDPDISPEVRARLMEEIGWVYFRLGKFERSETLTGRALDTNRRIFGEDSPEVQRAERLWGSALWKLGRYDEAVSALGRSLAVAVRRGPESEVGELYSALGALHSSLGRYAHAEELHRRALAVSEELFGSESQQAGVDLMNVAVALWRQGELTEAETAARRSLRIGIQTTGAESATTASSHHNLGSILVDEERFDEAAECFRTAIRLREGIYGPNHPDIAQSASGLSSILARTGDGEEALALAERAVAICRRVYGPDHAETAIQLNNLAKRFYTQEKLPRAALAMGEALAIWKRTLPPGHPDLTTGLSNLGMIHFANGDLDRAENLLRESIDHERKSGTAGSGRLALSLCNLGRILSAAGRHPEAVQSALEASEIAELHLDPTDGLRRTIANRLAEIREVAAAHD